MNDFMDFVEIASTAQRGEQIVVVLCATVPPLFNASYINHLAEQFITDLMQSQGIEFDKLVVEAENGEGS